MHKLVDKYASIIDLEDLTDDEADFIGNFTADMTRAKMADDEEAMDTAIAAFFHSMPEEVAEKVALAAKELAGSGDLEKQAFLGRMGASLGRFFGRNPVGLAMTTSAAGTAIPALMGAGISAISKAVDKMTADRGSKVLSHVMKSHPELKTNAQQVTANYATIQKFAPTLAKDPNAVGGLLKQLNQLGETGLTYNTLSELSKMESNVQKAKSTASPGFAREVGGAMSRDIQSLGQRVSGDVMSQMLRHHMAQGMPGN